MRTRPFLPAVEPLDQLLLLSAAIVGPKPYEPALLVSPDASNDVVIFSDIETDDSGEMDVSADANPINTGEILGQLTALSSYNPPPPPGSASLTPPDDLNPPIVYSGSSNYLNVLPDGEVQVTDGPGLTNYLSTGGSVSMPVTATDGGSAQSTVNLNAIFDWFDLSFPQVSMTDSAGNTYSPTTGPGLVSALNSMAAAGLTITSLNIKGHGSPDGIAVGGSGDWLTTATNPGAIYIGNTDVTNLLRSVTNANSQISFVGCFTYELAQRTEGLLGNGAQVYGATRFVMGIPGAAHGFGSFY